MTALLVDALRLEAVAINALVAEQSETIAEQAARHEADNAIIARLTEEVARLSARLAEVPLLDDELRLVHAHWDWQVVP